MAHHRLSRRFFLSAAGATIALPLLDALGAGGDRTAKAQAMPNAVFLMFPIGNIRGTWNPTSFGAGYGLPSALDDLAPYRDELVLLQGLEQPGYRGYGPATDEALRLAGGIPGGHHFLATSLLTCNIPRLSGPVTNTESIDNRLARHLGQPRATYLTAPDTGIYDEGYSKEYLLNFSWQQDGTKNQRYDDPARLFESLFGRCTDPGVRAPRYQRHFGSILDAVTGDLRSLEGRASSVDRARLDRYLTGLREVEQSIQTTSDLACAHPEYLESPSAYLDATQRNLDLITLGIASGRSRVFSYLMDREISQRQFSWLGIRDGHHSLSHDASGRVHAEEIAAIAKWYVSQMGYLLGRLRDEELLRDTVVFLGSIFSNEAPTDSHLPTDLPILLAGSAGGRIRTGQGVDVRRVPLANLYLTMLQRLGAADTSFGQPNPDPSVYTYPGASRAPDPRSTGTIAAI